MESVWRGVNEWVRAMEREEKEGEKGVGLPVVCFRNFEGFERALGRLRELRGL
jgi:hypothetical protein